MNGKLTGEILCNGEETKTFDFYSISSYVQQEDILMSTLTVKESLIFSAKLRLQGTENYKLSRVNDIIE